MAITCRSFRGGNLNARVRAHRRDSLGCVGGFSPESLRDRINDAKAKVLITADAGYRRGRSIPLKRNSDKALEEPLRS